MKAVALSIGIAVLVVRSAIAEESQPRLELQAVVRALQPTLDKLEPAAKVEFEKSSPTVKVLFLPQNFKIHGRSKPGEIAAEAHDEIGPSYKGFVLAVHLESKGEVNQAVTSQTIREPYWQTNLDGTPLRGSDKQIFWALSYGSRADQKVLNELRKLLNGLATKQGIANTAGLAV